MNPAQFDLNFQHDGSEYNVHLVPGKAEQSVEINGVPYVVLEDHGKSRLAFEILNKISMNGVSSPEDLKGRLSVSKSPILNAAQIVETVRKVADELEQKYVFQDVGTKCSNYLRQQLDSKAYKDITDPVELAKILNAELFAIAKDKHLKIEPILPFRSPQIADTANPLSPEETKDFHPDLIHETTYKSASNIGWLGETQLNYEFRAGFLKDNPSIGYFELTKFCVCGNKPSQSEELTNDVNLRRQSYIDTIQHLKGAKVIIIDMRQNSGGDPEAVQLLCSLFMEQNLPLNTIEWRTQEGFKKDSFSTLGQEQLPYSQRLLNTPIIVLGGPYTFSAGEEFMNDMQIHKRATIVGSPTAGAANPGSMYPINSQFEIFIPTGRAVNPIQNTNWEGTGIQPDIPCKEETSLSIAVGYSKSL